MNTEVLCIGETEYGKPFNWTENRIWLFCNYVRDCEKSKMCNCMSCFKKRFLKALEKVNRNEFTNDKDYEYAASKLIAF